MKIANPRSTHRFNHVGVAVSNLGEATNFYRTFLDTEPIADYENDRTPFLDQVTGYQTVVREAWFPLGDDFVELLEYSRPEPGTTDPETHNARHMHLRIEVEDVGAEYERLREADIGIEFRSDGPVTIPDEEPDFVGERYIYLRTPDGSTFELFQAAPNRATSARVLEQIDFRDRASPAIDRSVRWRGTPVLAGRRFPAIGAAFNTPTELDLLTERWTLG